MKQRYRTFLFLGLLAIASAGNRSAGQDDPPTFTTSDSNVGYIDSAIPGTQVRLRFDSAFNNPVPDRAEFFYRASMAATGQPISPAETGVDYNDLMTYAEWAFSQNTSIFVEAPVRFLNPERNANTAGFSDLRIGGKSILWADESQIFTGQLRVFVPTGDADRLLGTDHVSLEPSLLGVKRLGPLTNLESEFRVWIPIGGTEIAAGNFAGTTLRYGVGIGHDLFYEQSHCPSEKKRLTAVAEFVGWTILDGFATVPATPALAQLIDVDGDTIVNAKLGLRWTDADRSFFIGYGRALTGDTWYGDIVRAEYAIRF